MLNLIRSGPFCGLEGPMIVYLDIELDNHNNAKHSHEMCDIMLKCTRANLLIWEIKYSWILG